MMGALLRALPLVLVLASSAPAWAGDAGSPGRKTGFSERWISGRLTVGGRFTHYWLEDTRRSGENGYDNGNLGGNFLGSLWGLDAQQHWFPNPYLEYRAVSALGVAVDYDQVRARTLDWADTEHSATAGDGDVEIRGVGVSLVGRYRNDSRFEPFASGGYSWYWSHFEVSAGWAAPGRSFVVEDTEGWFATAGCRFRAGRHLGVDATYRHSWVGDVAAKAYLGIGNRYREGSFPMRYDALAIGASYTF